MNNDQGRTTMRNGLKAALTTGAFVAGALLLATRAPAQQTAMPGAAHPGEGIYASNCAVCHDHPEATRSPTKATLGAMAPKTIEFALTEGKMKAQGAALNDATRQQLISYLTGKAMGATEAAGLGWKAPLTCTGPRARAALAGPAVMTGFGFDRSGARALTRTQARLSKGDLTKMELAWSLGFPRVTMMRSQGAVVGDTVFLPVAEASALYAIDVSDPANPCVKWTYAAGGAPLRTSPAYGVLANGRQVLAVAGQDTTVHVIDAVTGAPLWKKKVGVYSNSMTTGTPTVLKDRLIVPVSQFEIMVAGSNSVTCCTNHGYVLSLDPMTGAQQWRYDTMPEAKPLRDRGDGKMLWGPSGAPIWNSPVVDLKRGLIYFGTGESNSPPAHKNTDALIAISLKDGHEVWSMQATERDIYNVGCGLTPKKDQYNCVADTVFRDVDFGASLILGKVAGGKELLFAGQKSGTLWALDPDTGKVAWKREIGSGSPMGGIHWGIAFDGRNVYVPITSLGRPLPGQPAFDPKLKPGLYALDGRTGEQAWAWEATPDCEGPRGSKVPRCPQQFAISAAPMVIDGAVVTGSLDGKVRVHDARNGAVMWTYDTIRDFETANGVPAKGGAIDAASFTVAGGMLLVNSGYGMFGQAPGNALLAFRAKR